jgi:hypothetical protein
MLRSDSVERMVMVSLLLRFRVTVLGLAFFLPPPPHNAMGAEKQRYWQTGKVLDSQRSRYFAGTMGTTNTTGTAQANSNNGTYQGTTTSSERAVYRVYETFLIEGETHAYLAQERMRWKWSRPANLTVNGPVKFAIEKRNLFVIDEDGKEHEMEIVKKVLREPAGAKP